MRATRPFAVALLLACSTAGACERDPRSPEDEVAALRSAGAQAAREGGILRLLTGAGPLEFRDADCDGVPGAVAADGCVEHLLAAHLPERGAFVVFAGRYEGGGYLLVDIESGRTESLHGFPRFSPDGARFVTVTGEDPYDFNLVDVWRVSRGDARREQAFGPPDEVTYCFLRWAGPDRVELRGTRRSAPQPLGEWLEDFDATLLLRDGSWAIEPAGR